MSPVPDKAKNELAVPVCNSNSDNLASEEENFGDNNVDACNEGEELGDGAIEVPDDPCDDPTVTLAPLDPLTDLVEKTKSNPGAPFAEEVIIGLAALKRVDRLAFETLRSELKSAGCRVAALDQVIEGSFASDGADDKSQAALLVAMVDTTDLFIGQDGAAYADLAVDGHRETFPIRDVRFRNKLRVKLHREHDQVVGSSALDSAISLLEAVAIDGESKNEVGLRVVSHRGCCYLDLADDTWTAIVVDDQGWRFIPEPPVRFMRAPDTLPLPMPVAGGTIDLLRKYLNLDVG